MLGAGRKDTLDDRRALVCVLVSASKRLPELAERNQPLMLIVDECHRGSAAADTEAAGPMSELRYDLFSEEHEALRHSVRDFVAREIRPHVDEWEALRDFPRSLYERCGELGLFGLKYEEEYGGSGPDLLADAVVTEELTLCGAGGVSAGLGAHKDLGSYYVYRFGNDEQRKKWLVPSIRGEVISALGVTEPGAGSDVASIKTTANRLGGDWVINGGKMWTTNGAQADWMCLLANTAEGPVHRNKSLICVPMKTSGVQVVKKLDKLGLPGKQVIAEVLQGLLNAAQVKLGRRDARLLIDLSASVVDHARPHLSGDLASQVDQALSQLRMGQVEAEKEVVNIVVANDQVDRILERMYLAGKLDTPGMGFMYVTPLEKAATFVPEELIAFLAGAQAEGRIPSIALTGGGAWRSAVARIAPAAGALMVGSAALMRLSEVISWPFVARLTRTCSI